MEHEDAPLVVLLLDLFFTLQRHLSLEIVHRDTVWRTADEVTLCVELSLNRFSDLLLLPLFFLSKQRIYADIECLITDVALVSVKFLRVLDNIAHLLTPLWVRDYVQVLSTLHALAKAHKVLIVKCKAPTPTLLSLRLPLVVVDLNCSAAALHREHRYVYVLCTEESLTSSAHPLANL